MSAVCSSNRCISAADGGRRPPRAAYINLYNWTDSDGEVAKSAIRRVPVADGVSCRQMYLRSYKFSTKESVPEKTRRCFGKVKRKLGQRNRNRKCCLIWRKMKEFSCGFVLFGSFRRILSCAASVDVVEQSSGRTGSKNAESFGLMPSLEESDERKEEPFGSKPMSAAFAPTRNNSFL